MNGPELLIALPYEPPATLAADAYADTGLVASVYWSRGLQEVAYIAVTAALTQLSSAAAQKLGEDAYAGIKRLLGRLRDSATPEVRGLQLIDRDSGVTFELDDKAFEDRKAWRELGKIDVRSFRKGTTLQWDQESGQWRSK